MRRSRKYRPGVQLLIVGLLGLLVAVPVYFWSKKMNAVPLEIPLSLSAGHIQSPDFTTHVSIPYNVDIAFDTTKIPLSELDCLIGTNLETVEPCTNQPAILNVKWTLISGDRPVATGSSTDAVGAGYSYHKTARHLGNFHSESGRQYRLDLDVLGDGARLNVARPKLEITPLLVSYEGRFLLTALELLVSAICVTAGCIIALISILRGRRLGKLPNDNST